MRASNRGGRFWLVGMLWSIQVMGQDFTISTIAGGAPQATPAAAITASIGRPAGLAADAAGNIYFSTFSNYVLKLDITGAVTLVAGNSRWGYSGDGGPATAAQFRWPRGIALDDAGNLYIADSWNNCVRRVSPAGIITTVAGNGENGFSGDTGPATSARLSEPVSVAVDSAGNLYIADTGNNRIRRVSPAGIITTVPGTEGLAGQNYLFGVAADKAGNVYYSDWDNNWIRRVTPSGTVTTVASASAQLRCPSGLALDAAGNLYVADTWNHQIRRQIGPDLFTPVAGTGVEGFTGDGGIATSARLSQPDAVAVDRAGNIYIADLRNHRIRRVAAPASGMIYTGVISTVAGDGTENYSGDGGPATSAQMNPLGVAADGGGNVYLSDASNRIRRVSPSGAISTVAGSGAFGYSGDNGPATSAQLCQPFDVAADQAGNLYIADHCNQRIRRVSTAGIITTVAGDGAWGFGGDGGPATSAQFRYPTGVAVDAAGNLYIMDAGNVRVRRVSPSGIIDTVAGNGSQGFAGDGGPATSAQFRNANTIAVDHDGTLYIADTGNHRVRRVTPAGIITTVAGTGSQGFSGDGGLAVFAQLSSPYGVTVDGAGNIYISDSGNHRIRRLSTSTSSQSVTISTIAGDGNDQYSGDGGPALSAQLDPDRLAADSTGRVYISTGNAVRLLTPICTPSAAPAAFTIGAAGGPLTLTIQAAAGCSWTVTGMPAWITASATAGSGPANVTLNVTANTGAARSTTMEAAGTSVTVSQAAASPVCAYSITPNSRTFTSAGGQGAVAVSTAVGCPWTASSPVAWITITSGAPGSGNGNVTYQVMLNSTGVLRSTQITIAGIPFTVEQTAAGAIASGTMAQVASGGTWKTTFTLVNNDSVPVMARLTFTADDGSKLTLPLTFPQTGGPPVQAGIIEPVLDPGATFIVEAEGPEAEVTKQGFAELFTDAAVTGFAVFRQRVGEREQEAVVPLETRTSGNYVLAFDNSSNFVTGAAIANLASQDLALTVIINDDLRRRLHSTSLLLAARGHTAFELHKQYPVTAGKRGTIEFRPPGAAGISVLGLRFHPKGAFTTIPVWAR